MSSELAVRPVRPEVVLRAALAALLALLLGSGLAYALFGFDLLAFGSFFPSCWIRAATGFSCPGCGMTRALLLLFQLRIGEALAAHPAAPLLAAALVWGVLRPARIPVRKTEPLLAASLALVLALWRVRVLPGD